MRVNYRVLSIYLLGVFIGALDTNVLGPAFRVIAANFHVTLGVTAWTITAYSVAYVAATALFGALGDRLGHRRIFGLGVALFGLASVVAAFSPNLTVFLLARSLQGAGAGAVYPNAQAEGLGQFPANKRGMALGMFGAVFGLASIIGPNLGGALTQFVGWPAIFLINVPLAVVALLSLRRLPASVAALGRGIPDWQGGASFSLMLAFSLLAISSSGLGQRLAFLVLAGGAVVWFVRRQHRAQVPFVDGRPLANRAGMLVMIGAGLVGLDMASAVFVPAYAQEALHLGILASGFALMPAALAGAVLAGAGGMLVDRIGPRRVLIMGLLAAACGGALLAWTPLVWSRFLVAMVFLGIGTAFTMGAPLNRMGLDLYRAEQSAEALSLMAVFRSVGIAAGPILLTMARTAFHGFSGMYGEVALASLLAIMAFALVPVHAMTVGEAVSTSDA